MTGVPGSFRTFLLSAQDGLDRGSLSDANGASVVVNLRLLVIDSGCHAQRGQQILGTNLALFDRHSAVAGATVCLSTRDPAAGFRIVAESHGNAYYLGRFDRAIADAVGTEARFGA